MVLLRHDKRRARRSDKAPDENVDHLKSISITNGSNLSNNCVNRAGTN